MTIGPMDGAIFTCGNMPETLFHYKSGSTSSGLMRVSELTTSGGQTLLEDEYWSTDGNHILTLSNGDDFSLRHHSKTQQVRIAAWALERLAPMSTIKRGQQTTPALPASRFKAQPASFGSTLELLMCFRSKVLGYHPVFQTPSPQVLRLGSFVDLYH